MKRKLKQLIKDYEFRLRTQKNIKKNRRDYVATAAVASGQIYVLENVIEDLKDLVKDL